MMQRRPFEWGSLVGSLALIGLGILLLTDRASNLPEAIRRYWPAILIAWGLWDLTERYRVKEDLWAGTDYGTGLYVIRHRHRRRNRTLTGIVMLLAGLVLVSIGLLRLSTEHMNRVQIFATVLGALVIAAIGYATIRVGAPKATYKEYENRVVAWECTFLCLKCGNRFAQDV